jgi:hypothetical protein
MTAIFRMHYAKWMAFYVENMDLEVAVGKCKAAGICPF